MPNDRGADRPTVRPAQVFRALVMTALAAAPLAAGCPSSTPPPQDQNVPAASADAGAESGEPVVRPMYGVEPYVEPSNMDYGVPVGVEEYGAPVPYDDDPGIVAEYMAPMPRD